MNWKQKQREYLQAHVFQPITDRRGISWGRVLVLKLGILIETWLLRLGKFVRMLVAARTRRGKIDRKGQRQNRETAKWKVGILRKTTVTWMGTWWGEKVGVDSSENPIVTESGYEGYLLPSTLRRRLWIHLLVSYFQ